MTTDPEAPSTAAAPAPRDRRRLLAAIALFLAWMAFLAGLAATDAYRPQERAGTVPAAPAPDEG